MKVKLNGRYLIEKELGRGGFGVVYLARDMRLDSLPVVIKTMLGEQDGGLRDPWFSEKFEKEIKALLRIRHPGVVGVSDVGQMPDGKPFFVMQYVEGETLSAALRKGAMGIKRAAQIVRQIGYALSAAHDQGITHRDLKPDNVILRSYESGEEAVILIDFGIATVRDLQARRSDAKTRVVGTLPYMAPEQLLGEPTPASDIWALGVLTYQMVTGRLPFPADNTVTLSDMQRMGVRTMPRALRPELPAAAEDAILKALSHAPSARQRSAHEFGESFLRAVLGDEAGPTQPADERTLPRGAKILPLEEATLVASETTTGAQGANERSAPKHGAATTADETPEIGHVLFMDLVSFSLLPVDRQPALLKKLRGIVLDALAAGVAAPDEHRIIIDTGDGLALVFFRNPMAPVQCALQVAHRIKDHPDVRLRMGVHSGPVYRRRDINEHLNVTGPGIHFAQRVMDSGDAGHILLSRNAADILLQMGEWHEHLHDLGDHEVKHGVRIHLYNLCRGGLGCPDRPAKLGPDRAARSSLAPPPRKGAAALLPSRSFSAELHRRCSELFAELDEFSSPDKLRAFARVSGIETVRKCVPSADRIDFDILLSRLMSAGRSRPALIDLLEALSARYEDDLRGEECDNLIEEINGRLP